MAEVAGSIPVGPTNFFCIQSLSKFLCVSVLNFCARLLMVVVASQKPPSRDSAKAAYYNGAQSMEKNTPNNPKPIPQPPQPIQGNKVQDNTFNVHKKPESKDAAPQGIDQRNVDDMDGNSIQKVDNDADGNVGENNLVTKNGPASNESPSTDQWKTKISSAKHQWNKLQQEELVASCGNSDQLSSLIQKRYAVDKKEADKQVAEFFSKQ